MHSCKPTLFLTESSPISWDSCTWISRLILMAWEGHALTGRKEGGNGDLARSSKKRNHPAGELPPSAPVRRLLSFSSLLFPQRFSFSFFLHQPCYVANFTVARSPNIIRVTIKTTTMMPTGKVIIEILTSLPYITCYTGLYRPMMNKTWFLTVSA